FFPTAEGFYDFENKEYIYQYKDHLGNVRLSYKDDGNQNPIVTDSNDFYPFGMNFIRNEEENAVFGAGSYVNYKYNRKELQETGMYDYGARFYMPDIGRWGVVDGLSEGRPNMSPYRYSFNNPVNATDPNGLWEDWYQNNKTNNIEWHDGSAEIDGYTNLTAINNTRVIESENRQTKFVTDLHSDGSFTTNGVDFSGGDSRTT